MNPKQKISSKPNSPDLTWLLTFSILTTELVCSLWMNRLPRRSRDLLR